MNKFLTVFFITFAVIFTGCKSDEPDNQNTPYIIEAQVVDGESYDIFEVRALTTKPFDYEGTEYFVAAAPFVNGGFKMELPANLRDEFLVPASVMQMQGCSVSNEKAKFGIISELEVVFTYESGMGALLRAEYAAEENGGLWTARFMYTDKDVRISGTFYDDNVEDNMTIDVNLKAGWNMVYDFFPYKEAEYNSITQSTKPNLNFKWYINDNPIFYED
jgi:hypothetical protein